MIFKLLDPPISPLDFATTFGHECGKRVLQDLQEGFHVTDAMFAPGIDAMTLAFREGQRSVVLWLLSNVEAAMLNTQAVLQETTDGQPL